MDAGEIKDKAGLKAWLETLPEQVGGDEARRIAVWLASRAALRVLPLAWGHFAGPEAGKRDLTPLPLLRRILISSVASTVPTDDIRRAAAASADVAAFSSPAVAADAAASAVAASADVATFSSSAVAADAAASAVFSSSSVAADASAWASLRRDIEAVAAAETLPLWRDGPPEDWPRIDMPPSIPDTDGESAADWSFWVGWYDDLQQGRPQNWDMLTEIALIAPEHWEKGPAIVNPMIDLIVEKYRLRAEAAALKEQAQQTRTALENLEHRGHNNPPELVDAGVPEARQAVTLIWEVLDEAETELAKPQPSPSRLRVIADRLGQLFGTFAVYCGGKIDVALTEVAKGLGKIAAPATATYLLAQQPQLQGFAKALWDLAAKLAN